MASRRGARSSGSSSRGGKGGRSGGKGGKGGDKGRVSRGSSGGGSRSSGGRGGGRSGRSSGSSGRSSGSRGGKGGGKGGRGGGRRPPPGGKDGKGSKGDKGSSKKRSSKKTKKKKAPNPLVKLCQKLPCCLPPVEVIMNSTAKQASKSLGFQELDLAKIKRRFDDIDLDLKGEISYEEFLDDVNEARSAFTDAVFAMVDVNGNGELDFDEYIQIFMTYCMFNRDEILTFTYECFDKDNSGTIDEEEFMLLAKTVNNSAPMFPGNFGTALEEFDQNDDGLIDMDEFRELNRRYPMVLFPAFRFQDALQRGSLGPTRWTEIATRKNKLAMLEEYRKNHKGQLPPVSGYIECCSKINPCCYKHPHKDLLEDLTGTDEDDTSAMSP